MSRKSIKSVIRLSFSDETDETTDDESLPPNATVKELDGLLSGKYCRSIHDETAQQHRPGWRMGSWTERDRPIRPFARTQRNRGSLLLRHINIYDEYGYTPGQCRRVRELFVDLHRAEREQIPLQSHEPLLVEFSYKSDSGKVKMTYLGSAPGRVQVEFSPDLHSSVWWVTATTCVIRNVIRGCRNFLRI